MSDVRERIGSSLHGLMSEEYISALLDEVLAQKKQVHAEVSCKHCSRKGKYQVEVLDAAAVTKALIELGNQAWGRPDVAQQAESEKINFKRIIYMQPPSAPDGTIE